MSSVKLDRAAVKAALVAVGLNLASGWKDSKLQEAIKKLDKYVTDLDAIKDKKAKKLIQTILEAKKKDKTFEFTGDDKPPKAGPEEEDSETQEGSDVEDSAEEGEEEGEEEAPKKKDKKKDKKPKEKKERGPGVIGTIEELLRSATEDKPLSKIKLKELLAKKFPDRDADAMAKTIQVQVPNRLKTDKGLNVKMKEGKNGKAYWIE